LTADDGAGKCMLNVTGGMRRWRLLIGLLLILMSVSLPALREQRIASPRGSTWCRFPCGHARSSRDFSSFPIRLREEERGGPHQGC
jgi:hypothetical protein